MPRETEHYFKVRDSRDELRVVASPEFGLVKFDHPTGHGELVLDLAEAERLGAALLGVEPTPGFPGTFRKVRT